LRRFFLSNPDFEVPSNQGLVFNWSALDTELAYQIAFQQQFLRFYKHLLENLQSVPSENPEWAPRQLSLSLRAGAVKTYVLIGVSIAEAALFGLAVRRGLGTRNQLRRHTYGQLLGVWSEEGEPRPEVQEIWAQLRLLNRYRNHIHLANAADDPHAYWDEILNQENDLIGAVDVVVQELSNSCDAFGAA
jgi:hypothetical protein